MRRHPPLSSVVTALLALPLTALAEETPGFELKEMVVTATRTEKDSADAPAAVSVVDATEIEVMNVQSADEALRLLPGAYATRPGGHQPSVMGTNVLLRGIPDYSRTLVLVDGQVLNDPYIGAVTWEAVPPEIIDRIEVVPGPFSSLYGGSAMGGVINIITKAPQDLSVGAKATYGTDNFRGYTLVYQDRYFDRVGLLLNASQKQSDGYVKDEVVRSATNGGAGTAVAGAVATTDPYGNPRYRVGDKGDGAWESLNAGAKVYVDLPARGRIALGASHFDYEKKWDTFHTYLADAAGNPVSSGPVTFNDNGTDKQMTLSESLFLSGPNPKEQNRYSLEYDQKLGAASAFKLLAGYVDTPMYDTTTPATGATLNGGPGTRLHRPNRETSASAQLTTPVAERHLLVTGVAAGKREIETYQFLVSDWRDEDATGAKQNQTAGQDQYYAVFAQDEILLTDRVTAYLGGRYDWWSTEGYIQQFTAPAYRNEYSERSLSYFSPKASLVYRPAEGTTLRASAGKAFRPPVLRDTFGWWVPPAGLTFVPNPDLKPETLTAWELGAEQRVGRGTLLRATYYDSTLKDLIYRTQTTTTQSIENAARARIRGVEAEVRQQLTSMLQAFVNATYNDAKIVENPAKPATEGKRMTRTPQKMANIGVQGRQGPWGGSLSGHYVGKTYANDENLDVVSNVYGSYDAYFLVDAKVSYAVHETTTLSLAVDNLLDREYYESTRAQGRAVYGEISLRF